jgi:hypothetical protein
LIEPLQRNWVSIYFGGGASSICNDRGFSWFRDRGDLKGRKDTKNQVDESCPL